MLNRIMRLFLALCSLGLLAYPLLAFAGSPLGIGTAEPSFPTGGPFGGFLSFINSEQQSFYRLLTDALKATLGPCRRWSGCPLPMACFMRPDPATARL
jgi:nickel/cobalt transporter (NicO) family protein